MRLPWSLPAMIAKGLLTILIFILTLAAGGGFLLCASRPGYDSEIKIPGLSRPVRVEFDSFGIPAIQAWSRLAAYQALGYLHAAERLFQMDLTRRKMTGRLSEIAGAATLKLDIRQRRLGFYRAAKTIFRHWPPSQQAICRAYAQGVNAWLHQQSILPPEFLLLRYHPEEWTCEDTILVSLAMFQMLNELGNQESMLAVMEKSLPKAVTAFLTPDEDSLDHPLLGGQCSRRPRQPVPVEDLAALLAQSNTATNLVDRSLQAASNQWAIAGWKSSTGQAILANDMHLHLGVPNIWYRARLQYGNVTLDGITLPGVPLMIAGSNGHIAWGFTNALADVIDLVALTTDPHHPDAYLTPEGWRPFQTFEEVIRIKHQPAYTFTARATRWGPVAPASLLNRPVAIRWTAFDPQAVDLKAIDIDQVETVGEALALFNQAGIPVLNTAVADHLGHIGWTLSGKLPLRNGFDGTLPQNWANGNIGWQGWVSAADIPRLIDPPAGFLVTANNRTLGCHYPLYPGHNYATSFRAHRITETLQSPSKISPRQAFSLQLDSKAGFYEFYRKLALEVLDQTDLPETDRLLAQVLHDWNGEADTGSRGLPLLVAFHQGLENAVFSPILSPCRQTDPHFRYGWFKREEPLRQILRLRHPRLLPNPQFANWNEFILHHLLTAKATLETNYGKSIDQITWGEVNRASIQHPLSRGLPALAFLLDMPQDPLAGCRYCVRVALPDYGASMRLIAVPGNLKESILHMPGGQSGHPFSRHYRDQQPYWVRGLPLPLAPSE